MPPDWASRAGIPGGSFLTPIASPLVFSGFSGAAIRQFENVFAGYGMAAAQGGSIDARPDDRDIRPGDMVSAVLLEGDLSLNASCTVTTIVDGRVYVCGHPLFGFGSVQMPMARGARADHAQFRPGIHENCERRRNDRIVQPGSRDGRRGKPGSGAEIDSHRYDRGDAGW